MALMWLVALVTVGIAMVVALVHLTGGSQRASLGDARAIADRFSIDFPDAEVKRCFESADGYEALLVLADGSLGLVHTFGANTLTRHYRREELSTMISAVDEMALAFDPHEMTLPRLIITLESADARAELMAALGLSAIAVSRAA